MGDEYFGQKAVDFGHHPPKTHVYQVGAVSKNVDTARAQYIALAQCRDSMVMDYAATHYDTAPQ